MSIPKFNTIVYATDLGDKMRPVFRHAIGLAQHYQAKIIMLHVVEPLSATGLAVLDTYLPKQAAKVSEEGGLKKVLKRMKKRLEQFCIDEVEGYQKGKEASLVSDIVVVSGHSAEEINKVAEEYGADLIVVGTHTDSSFGHGLLGSTARKLTHTATRPLLVIPVGRD